MAEVFRVVDSVDFRGGEPGLRMAEHGPSCHGRNVLHLRGVGGGHKNSAIEGNLLKWDQGSGRQGCAHQAVPREWTTGRPDLASVTVRECCRM